MLRLRLQPSRVHLGGAANIVRALFFSTKKPSCTPFFPREHLPFIFSGGGTIRHPHTHDRAGVLRAGVTVFWLRRRG
jgi:hypothetical protein